MKDKEDTQLVVAVRHFVSLVVFKKESSSLDLRHLKASFEKVTIMPSGSYSRVVAVKPLHKPYHNQYTKVAT